MKKTLTTTFFLLLTCSFVSGQLLHRNRHARPMQKNIITLVEMHGASGNRTSSYVDRSVWVETSGTIPGVASVSTSMGLAGDFEETETEYLYAPNTTIGSFSISDDFTVCAWHKPESDPGNSMKIVAKYDSASQREWRLGLNSDQTDCKWQITDTAASTETSTKTSVSSGIGVWSLCCGVFEASGPTMHTYCDGLAWTTKTYTKSDVANHSQKLTIGGAFGAGVFNTNSNYDGLIDNFIMWDRALSQEELDFLWNSGNGKAYPW